MDFKDIIEYRKALFDYLISDIDSFNKVYKTTLFSQGFAKWYLSKFVAGDVVKMESMIFSEAFAVREGGYLVLVKSGNDISCYVFNVPEQSGMRSGNSFTGLGSDSFSVVGNTEFCQNALERIINEGFESADGSDSACDVDGNGDSIVEDDADDGKYSVSFIFVTLSDSISIHTKKSLRKSAAFIKAQYPDNVMSSNASFVVGSDVVKKFSTYLVTKNPDSYNILDLIRSITKDIDEFAEDVFFDKTKEAKLIFLSMLSGVDAAVISQSDDSLVKILEENIRLYFEDCEFLGRIKYMKYDPGMFDRSRESGIHNLPSSVFYIPNRNTFNENVFYKMVDSFSDALSGKITSRPINKLDLIYLREKAKRISISQEIKYFLFEMKNKFDNLEYNSVNSRYEIPDSAWISFSLLFRISAILSSRKEVDYSDLVLIENAACSFAENRSEDVRWISKLLRNLITSNAFMPLRLESVIPMNGDGMLEFDTVVRTGEDDDEMEGVYINDLHGTHLDVKVTDAKIVFKKEDCLYSYEEAFDILTKNEMRLQNLIKKYTTSLKRANYYTHKYDADILGAINARLNENAEEKARLEKNMKSKKNA